jgi:hypothetical protein
VVVKLAIALLFFLHGAKLSREAVVAGVTHWRLHLTILAFTFVLFPILGVIAAKSGVLSPTLAAGMLFLCCLPSTVQSSIAFTSIARGNVAAAVCAASGLEPAGHLPDAGAGQPADARPWRRAGGWESIKDIVVQLLLPFIAGQLVRPLIGKWIEKHKKLIGYVDRGSILLVVYSAFSAAVSAASGEASRRWRWSCCWRSAACCWPSSWRHHLRRASPGLLQGRRDRHRVLRLQEEPGHRRADGGHPVPRRHGGVHGAAADDLPPDPADGLLGDRPALRQASRRRAQGLPGFKNPPPPAKNPPMTFDSQKPLAGRIALVTGASRGIGEAVALGLAKPAPTSSPSAAPRARSKPWTTRSSPPPASTPPWSRWTCARPTAWTSWARPCTSAGASWTSWSARPACWAPSPRWATWTPRAGT